MKKIPYLKELGINAVEMMPILSLTKWAHIVIMTGVSSTITGAITPYVFFAPNTSYESDHEHHHEGRELKQLVRELHEKRN